MMSSEEEESAPVGPAADEPAAPEAPAAGDVVAFDVQRRFARPSAMELPGFDEQAFVRAAERAFPAFPRSERYAGVELLDTGATSSVWRAFDQQLQLDVAIKVFDRSNRTLDEVLDEARASCAVRHDFVVRVIDVVSDDPPFIVMELVGELGADGYQIGASAFVDRPRSLHEAVRWVCEAAAGVHAAHQRFVSHRDLKPRNVLIAPVSRRAMVADFGLGIVRKRRDAASGDRCIVGTTTHMAPEQALGMSAALDMRGSADDRRRLVAVDVFGLGALAFDLVTGNPPYALDQERDAHERALACDRARLLGSRTSWKRRMPRRLARIIDKAMAAEPGDRYPTAAALEADLMAWSQNLSTTIDGSSRATRAWLWVWRDPSRAMALVLLAVIAVAILALRSEVRSSRRQLQYLQNRRTEAEQRVEAARAEQAAVVTDIARSRRDLDAAVADRDAAMQQREAALQQRDSAVQLRDDARRDLDKERAQVEREQRRRQTEHSARIDAEQDSEQWQRDALRWQSTTAAASATAASVRKQMREAQALVAEKQKQLEELQAKLQVLETARPEGDASAGAAVGQGSAQPSPSDSKSQIAPPKSDRGSQADR
jgi:hypothetical protein